MDIVWLASYPRSGNTLLRTILWQCFGLRSASIYPNDLGGNKKLEEVVGHIEPGLDRRMVFPNKNPPLLKTHEYPPDSNPAIYVVRDGRAASLSLWKFYHDHGVSSSLLDVIEGHHKFGTWASHVAAWRPWERENVLFLEYEDLRCNLQDVLPRIGDFLQREALNDRLPERSRIAQADGQWVKDKTEWEKEFDKKLLRRFNEINGEMLDRLGYRL